MQNSPLNPLSDPLTGTASDPATIRAAHDLTIEIDVRRWRLYNGARLPDQPDSRVALLDARAEQIVCAPAFAQARRLPHTALAPVDIARVVVGWAPETRSWHLGLLLAAQPETDYKPRWCPLASWPRSDASTHMYKAQHAGQSLAHIINRPFHLIPAPDAAPPVTGDTQPIQATDQIAATEIPQMVTTSAPEVKDLPAAAPPFTFEQWALQTTPSGLIWKRRARWIRASVLRAVGFGVLVLLYLVLGVGSQISGLASVNPDWLPWLGLAVAAVLAALALRQIWLVLRVADMIVDADARTVKRCERFSGRVRWKLPFEAVAYVLVSQTPARGTMLGMRLGGKASGENGNTVPITQDVWLHLSDGVNFYPVAVLEDVEGVSHQWDVTRQRQKTAGRRRLRLAQYDTPAHHAARVLADAMQCDVWLDIR